MIRPDAIERFGLLSEAIQVKGAIAMPRISQTGMTLDGGHLEGVRAGIEKHLKGLEAELLGEPAYSGLLKLDLRGQVVRTEKGLAPSLNQKRLRELLQLAASEATRDTGGKVPLTTTASGQLSLRADEWEELAQSDPLVRTWTDLVKTAKTLQFFRNLRGSVIHPKYVPLVRTGRTSCSGPNIQNLPRKGGLREAFIASPGHFLLSVDYSFVELRTLAAECETRYGTSKLADVIRAGIDPHCYTAAMFDGIGLEEFMALKSSTLAEDRQKFDTLRQRAKVLNFGIPGGLGAKSLVAYAKSTYGVTLTLEEAVEFRRRLTEEVYPELGLYLADEGMEILARNLHVPVQACWRRFDREGGRSGAVVGGIRNIVRGRAWKADGRPYDSRYCKGVWDGLTSLNRDVLLAPLLAGRVGSEDLHRQLFHAGVTTLTGRIRGAVGFTQARNTPFQGLAADGAKLALWGLIKAGYRVVAFVHDEVLIELPEGADHAAEARKVTKLMNTAMETVTGTIPSACEYALSRRWSKQAKAVFIEGWLVPWEDRPTASSQ